MKPHLKNGKPPLIKPLRTQINQLIAEKNALYKEFNILKKDFSDIDKMKRNVDLILDKDSSLEREKYRKRDYGLE